MDVRQFRKKNCYIFICQEPFYSYFNSSVIITYLLLVFLIITQWVIKLTKLFAIFFFCFDIYFWQTWQHWSDQGEFWGRPKSFENWKLFFFAKQNKTKLKELVFVSFLFLRNTNKIYKMNWYLLISFIEVYFKIDFFLQIILLI